MKLAYVDEALIEADTRHYFNVSVTIRGAGSDWTSDPCMVMERAYNLHDAMRQATERPLNDWFAADIEEEREEDHAEALLMNELKGCLLCGRPLPKRRWWQICPIPWCGNLTECRLASKRPAHPVPA